MGGGADGRRAVGWERAMMPGAAEANQGWVGRGAGRATWRMQEGTGRVVGRDNAVRGDAVKGREGQSVLSKEVKDETTRRRRLPELWYGHGTRRGMAVMGACVAWDRSG